MSDADEYKSVLVSAIAHYGYCPRRCALIHVEHQFDENVFTLRGSSAHVRADIPSETTEQGVKVERSLPIWSEQYGLQGRADLVEFREDGSIRPVEYKHGPEGESRPDKLQLCAQALCLEEMFGCAIPYGEVYSSTSHTRHRVEFTDELRGDTQQAIQLVRKLVETNETPPPVNDARCPKCSLVHACMPSISVALSDFDVFRPTDGEVLE